jgi:hypothetical protein
MYHIELHGIESMDDIRSATESGLLDEKTKVHTYECADCDKQIGNVSGSLVPFVIAFEDEEFWTVCMECAAPIVDPGDQTDED